MLTPGWELECWGSVAVLLLCQRNHPLLARRRSRHRYFEEKFKARICLGFFPSTSLLFDLSVRFANAAPGLLPTSTSAYHQSFHAKPVNFSCKIQASSHHNTDLAYRHAVLDDLCPSLPEWGGERGFLYGRPGLFVHRLLPRILLLGDRVLCPVLALPPRRQLILVREGEEDLATSTGTRADYFAGTLDWRLGLAEAARKGRSRQQSRFPSSLLSNHFNGTGLTESSPAPRTRRLRRENKQKPEQCISWT